MAEDQRHASVYDFRDTDLMMKLNEMEGASAADLADEVGMDGYTQAIGVRLGWMKRYGMVEQHKNGIWLLSPGGGRVIEAHLRAAMQQVIEKVPDESMIAVMSHITGRYRLGDPMVAAMLRREFQYGTSPRRGKR
jgi:hypothetical protein